MSAETRAAASGHGEPAFEQLRGLTEISRALTYTTSLDQVMRLTVMRGAQLLAARMSVLMLADEEGLLQVRAAHGIDPDLVTRFREPLDDDLMPRLQGLLEITEDRFLGVPLVVGGEVTGLLAVATGHVATAADEWLLSALADQTAVALENARLGGEVRVAMEERLRASDSATNAKDRALNTLAHDIRTPLGAIEGYCGVLEAGIHGPVNEQQRETLARIRMSGRHLLALLDNVMDMARLDAGVVHVGAAPVRLVEVAAEAIQLLLPAAEARLQTLVTGEMSDEIVVADHDRLRQVMVNLIGNAVKFTPESGRILVTVTHVCIDGIHSSQLRVSDTGPGIGADEQAAIFEPYYRSTGAEHTAGVGLGLAICRGLMEQMGGQLLVESDAGGATFIVQLPARG